MNYYTTITARADLFLKHLSIKVPITTAAYKLSGSSCKIPMYDGEKKLYFTCEIKEGRRAGKGGNLYVWLVTRSAFTFFNGGGSYCKFGNFCKGFIFSKLRLCEVS